jgi:tyrosine-protein kinase Etk/Wzc
MTPNTPPLHTTPPPANDDEIDLLGLIDVMMEAKWLVASVTAAALVLGGSYAFLSRPVYQANTLLQVEDSKPGAGSALGDAASLFDIKSPASAEMEILRSRLVVGKAVDDLQLPTIARPKRFPLIGNWLARKATELSHPGFLGMAGYVHGTESIRMGLLEVPQELEDKPLTLIATNGGYTLQGPDGETLTEGKVGNTLTWGEGATAGRVAVHALEALPGAHFSLIRRSRQEVIELLQEQLNILEKGKQSGVIEVSLKGPDAQQITEVLQAIGSNYVRQNVERKAAEADKTLGFLNGFLPDLKKQLERSEVTFNQFRNQKGTFDLSTEGQLALKLSVDLQTQLLALQQKRRELSSQFTASHPSIQVIDAQIATLNKEIAGISNQVKLLPNVEQELLRLTRDVKVNSELYINLLNSAQQLRLVREGKVGNVRVVDQAVTQQNPVAPKRPLIVALSAILGLFGGVALAFVRNAMHAGIKDSAEIEAHTGLNVFATVPHSPAQSQLYQDITNKVPGQHLLAVLKAEDPGIESLRSLRTALQFALLDARNNVVLFSGPTPGIGKSFVSANFAAVLGAGGKRVLLIDADLRKGYINQYFGLSRGPGLSELVSGSKNFDQVVQRNVVPLVDLIPTGALPPNPGELLLSPRASQLIEKLSAQYDLIIIDTPPVLAVSDTQVLAPVAGTVFLVAKANVTALGEIHESVKRLQQSGVTVKGVVFNDFKVDKRRYGGYGYRYSRYRYTNYKYDQR